MNSYKKVNTLRAFKQKRTKLNHELESTQAHIELLMTQLFSLHDYERALTADIKQITKQYDNMVSNGVEYI